MQNIVIEKPYQFIGPIRRTWWSQLSQWTNLHGMYLRRQEGVESYEIRDAERLKQSLRDHCGVMLAPNHCRSGDPLVLGWLAKAAGCHFYAMASWHLFHQSRWNTWAIRALGAFSLYREGVDRQAINLAIQILETAERPLIVFPEGAVTRTNDQLHALLDGVGFIARAAARKRAKLVRGGRVVVHPVAIKYLYQGNLSQAADDVLTEIEHRLSWLPQRECSLYDRIAKVGYALLCLKEIEYFGAPRLGTLHERLQGLIDRLLRPLEEEWLGSVQSGAVVPRVKALRIKILPEMTEGRLPPAERERRWSQLAAIYLAQQVSCYPPDYLRSRPSVDRFLETIERFEEDLTDRVRVHGKLRAIVQVGEAIEVNAHRDRQEGGDSLMNRVEHELQAMLSQLALESPLVEGLPDTGRESPPSGRSGGSASQAVRQPNYA